MFDILNAMKKNILLAIVIAAALLAWRLYLVGVEDGNEALEIWADSYQIMAILGGILGIHISKKWGGTRSLIGRASLGFSVGLLLQAFGQSVYAYYGIFKGIEAAYPSIGDIGFFGSIPCYIFGVLNLAKAAGAGFIVKKTSGKIIAIGIPAALLILSYLVFLNGYEITYSLVTFLDFGYPLGQAIYISLAITTLFLTNRILGGLFRTPILLLLFALVVQYFADFIFLYRSARDTYTVGGMTDIIYLVAYFVMTVSIFILGGKFNRINK